MKQAAGDHDLGQDRENGVRGETLEGYLDMGHAGKGELPTCSA